MEHHKIIRSMILKNDSMRENHLIKIKVTEHHVDLMPKAKLFKSVPYREEPKTRYLKQVEVEKLFYGRV